MEEAREEHGTERHTMERPSCPIAQDDISTSLEDEIESEMYDVEVKVSCCCFTDCDLLLKTYVLNPIRFDCKSANAT